MFCRPYLFFCNDTLLPFLPPMNQFNVYDRISLIISHAKKGPFDWMTISKKIENLYLSKGITKKTTLRTFQRDLEEIKTNHGIEIKYNRGTKMYEIDEDASSEPQKMALLESFDIIRAFELNQNINQYAIFENRKTRGTNHLFGLLHAIQNSHPVTFDYQKFGASHPSSKKVNPIGLKEYKNRWYLITQFNEDEIRTFGLDRIENLKIPTGKFRLVQKIDLKKTYDGVFGISNEEGKPIETVELHFGVLKGKYIKSMPLHEQQVILFDDDQQGLRISINVKINYDLISEILSHGDEVQVISPLHLRENILDRAKNICSGKLRQE